eukprot:gene12008-14680_t
MPPTAKPAGVTLPASGMRLCLWQKVQAALQRRVISCRPDFSGLDKKGYGRTLPAAPPVEETFPYKLKFETVSGSGADLQIRSLLDRQQFHDPDGEAEAEGISSAAWPIFGMLWPSGHVLANVMQTYELEGKRILELGCGLALASLVIHRRGGNITASDYHPLTAAFLLENLKLNHLPAMKYQTGNWSRENP